MGFDVKRFVRLPIYLIERLKCDYCHQIVDNAVETDCGHTFCRQCVHKWIVFGTGNECHKCGQTLTTRKRSKTMADNEEFVFFNSYLFKQNLEINSIINGLKIKCVYESNGCQESIELSGLSAHQKKCRHRFCTTCDTAMSPEGRHKCVNFLMTEENVKNLKDFESKPAKTESDEYLRNVWPESYNDINRLKEVLLDYKRDNEFMAKKVMKLEKEVTTLKQKNLMKTIKDLNQKDLKSKLENNPKQLKTGIEEEFDKQLKDESLKPMSDIHHQKDDPKVKSNQIEDNNQLIEDSESNSIINSNFDQNNGNVEQINEIENHLEVIKDLKQSNIELKQEVQRLTTELKMNNEMNGNIIIELKQNVSNLVNKLKHKTNCVEELKNKVVANDETEKLIPCLKNQILKLQEKEETTQLEIQSLKIELNEWQTKYNEIRELEDEVVKSITTIKELENKYKEVLDTNLDLIKELNESSVWKQKYEKREYLIRNYYQKLIDLKTIIKSNETELKNFSEDKNQMSVELNELKDKLNDKINELNEKDVKIESKENELNSVRNNLIQMSLDLSRSQRKYSELKLRDEEITKRVNELEEKNTNLSEEVVKTIRQNNEYITQIERKHNLLIEEYLKLENKVQNPDLRVELDRRSIDRREEIYKTIDCQDLHFIKEFINTISNQSFNSIIYTEVVLFGTHWRKSCKIELNSNGINFFGKTRNQNNFDVRFKSFDKIIFCLEQHFPLIAIRVDRVGHTCHYIRRRLKLTKSDVKGWFDVDSEDPNERYIIIKLINLESMRANEWLSLIIYSLKVRPEITYQTIDANRAQLLLSQLK